MSEQPAQFVFKLRHNIALDGDLLLARIELEALLPSPVADVKHIESVVGARHHHSPTAYTRPNGQQAFRAEASLSLLPDLIRRLSFIQRIYCTTGDTVETRAWLDGLANTVGPVTAYWEHEDRLLVEAIPHYALFELSDVVVRRSKSADDARHDMSLLLDTLLGRGDTPDGIRLVERALAAKSSTGHLAHDLHYYKAKFFPRLVRAVLNACDRQLGEGTHRVIDNFAGSGTTLLEAALLGMPGVGIDIDPLSVLICQAKQDVLRLDSALIEQQIGLTLERLNATLRGQLSLFDPPPGDTPIRFPRWMMKNRKMTDEIAVDLSAEINLLQTAIAACDPQVEPVLRAIMSDAIARRIRMRFLGTGVGRFSLTLSKTPLDEIFTRSLEKVVRVSAVWDWLRTTLRLALADSLLLTADTRRISGAIGQFDILLTSPPYLPASSGRESYTRARAPSLIALGMADPESVDDLAGGSIGSMNARAVDLESLLEGERQVVEWLRGDELRAIKAVPTARYFLDMRHAFGEMQRVLRPGGLAVVVSGKQNTFYRFSTRDVLYTVPTAQLLAEEARRCGFEVEGLHDLPLKKANMNARPRSLDDYYETLIMLRKPL